MCSKVVKRRHVTRQNRAASPMSERTSPDTHVASSQCKRANVAKRTLESNSIAN